MPPLVTKSQDPVIQKLAANPKTARPCNSCGDVEVLIYDGSWHCDICYTGGSGRTMSQRVPNPWKIVPTQHWMTSAYVGLSQAYGELPGFHFTVGRFNYVVNSKQPATLQIKATRIIGYLDVTFSSDSADPELRKFLGQPFWAVRIDTDG